MRLCRSLCALASFCLAFAPLVVAQPSPIEIGLTDLKLDISTMKGATVRVSGVLQVMGEMIMLKSEPFDMTPIWVNAKGLSRVDRKSLLTDCSTMCKATVVGKVADAAMGGKGLDALTLENIIRLRSPF